MAADRIQNVLLIVVDTLRARNVGLYGGSQDTTPAIDELGAEGVVFDRAICTQSGSWISYTTMFRGDHVFGFPLLDQNEFDHRLVESTYKMAYDSTPRKETVTGRLSDAGVHTSAIVSGSMLDRQWGWHLGFEKYVDECETDLQRLALRTPPTSLLYRVARKLDQDRFPPFGSRPAHRTAQLAQNELKRLSKVDDPWFFFLQFTDPHTPNARYPEVPADWHPYDQDVRRSDDAIERVVDTLDSLGLRDSTLVVLTADHGESLGEHGATRGHGQNVFEESVRVPLILVHPSLKPKRIDQSEGVVRVKDIAPTLLEPFDVDPPETFTGTNLLPIASGNEAPPKAAFTFARGHVTINEITDRRLTKRDAGPIVAVHTGTEKFLTTPALDDPFEWQFDLETDPRERRNLIGTERESDELRELVWEKIQEWEERAPEVPAGGQWSADHEMRQQLKDLGYLD